MPRPRLFIIESPNAADLLAGRQEAATLVNACRLIGYDVADFVVRSSEEFKETCRYIANIYTHSKKKEPPLFIQISAHGDEDSLGFGPDEMNWAEIAETLS